MKLRVEAADCYFYPDVIVTCSSVDAADPLIKREPVLVVEVLLHCPPPPQGRFPAQDLHKIEDACQARWD